MKGNLRGLLLFYLLLVLSGCTRATYLKGAWVNPEYQDGDLHKILVIGVSDNDTYLRLFEDMMSSKLNQLGVVAEPGYTLFPAQKRPDKKEIARRISTEGFDAMIISQVTGKSTEQIYHPGETYYRPLPYYYVPPIHSHGWYDYYYQSYEIIHEPGYVSTYKVVTVQSNIYATDSEALIWSAVSETVVDGDIEYAITSLVDTLVDSIVDKGLISY